MFQYVIYIPMRSWHCKFTSNVFICVSTFLMAYHYITSTIYSPNASNYGWIIIAGTISMEYYPLYDDKSLSTNLYAVT